MASAIDLCTAAQVQSQRTWWQAVQDFFVLSLNSQSVPAVCVPPGALLSWKNCPANLQRKWDLEGDEVELGVRFVQTSAEVNQYRDAIELPNGRQILLQDLPEGLRLQVTSFGGDRDGATEDILPSHLLIH